MTPTSYNIPTGGAGNGAGGGAPYAYVPGTGSVPLRGGTPNTTQEGNNFGPVTTTQQLVENGGTAYQNCPAATAQLVKTGAGRLIRLIVLATGTAAVSVYDNTAASGTVIFTIPANAAVGTIYFIEVPCTTGIYVGGTTNSPQILATFF